MKDAIKMLAFNFFPIVCALVCVYMVHIDRNGWAIAFFILCILGAVKPKTEE